MVIKGVIKDVRDTTELTYYNEMTMITLNSLYALSIYHHLKNQVAFSYIVWMDAAYTFMDIRMLNGFIIGCIIPARKLARDGSISLMEIRCHEFSKLVPGLLLRDAEIQNGLSIHVMSTMEYALVSRT